jgi:hypothetical protein
MVAHRGFEPPVSTPRSAASWAGLDEWAIMMTQLYPAAVSQAKSLFKVRQGLLHAVYFAKSRYNISIEGGVAYLAGLILMSSARATENEGYMAVPTKSLSVHPGLFSHNVDGSSPRARTQAAIDEMKCDEQGHYALSEFRLLIESGPLDITVLSHALMPHLVGCARCRHVLSQACEASGTLPDEPLAIILKDADEWARWTAAGQTAVFAAQKELLDLGIGYVYERDGVVYRRMADGHEAQLYPSEALTS